MKKLLLSTIVLFAFSLSIIVFQISCKKETKAQNDTNTGALKQLGKILYKANNSKDLYLANYDGSGKQKVNFTFPGTPSDDNRLESASISPDGKTLFLVLSSPTINNAIYSCNTDGSNMKLIVNELSTDEDFFGAY